MICLQVVLVVLFLKKMHLHLFVPEAKENSCNAVKVEVERHLKKAYCRR